MSVYLDTHIVVWLYAGERDRISIPAAKSMNANVLWVSPIVLLELEYLWEIGRITVSPPAIVGDLKSRIGLSVRNRQLDDVVDRARTLDWTRDVFDRMIVAQAGLDDVGLISSDRLVRKHYPRAIW